MSEGGHSADLRYVANAAHRLEQEQPLRRRVQFKSLLTSSGNGNILSALGFLLIAPPPKPSLAVFGRPAFPLHQHHHRSQGS
jgi:hypothetical protein